MTGLRGNSTYIFVLYDSIENSVFSSQILAPLLEHRKNFPTKKIVLISFEKKPISQELLKKIPNHIEIVLLRKFPFLGSLSLYPAICQLKKTLNSYDNYDLVARGPIAGYLCLRAQKKPLSIQIRGLLTEEYRYEHRYEKNWLLRKVHQWRALLYERLEKTVYRTHDHAPVHYQVVSKALEQHLHTTFELPSERVSIATHDISPTQSAQAIKGWRGATRTTLGVSDTTFVYCYNGSLKPWQCPEKIISFFKNALEKNPQSFLLILTPDVRGFEKILEQSSLAREHYKVISVEHHDIFRYLAACDVGVIFREEHILNWTSRPTKILEYYAVGLPVIHNTTVGLLVKKEKL